jgi:assimilatory nitrate reductase catalytic subunit
VRINTILRAVSERQLLTFEAIGAALGAGTNCGSCRPELAAIIARQTLQVAAE